MKKNLLAALAAASLCACGFAGTYAPVQGHIMTEWGEAMTPDTAWREYPRPNLVREDWTCLNGMWKLAVANFDQDAPKDEAYDKEILVPFAPEAALSGVGRLTAPTENLWYRRSFTIPSLDPGKRYFLNFEAVDWRCQVFVNGREATAAPHVGGNVPFSLEVTDLVKEGENQLQVVAWDPTDEVNQPRGKQSLQPQGCFYTRVSGIYGSVWMEAVPRGYIESYRAVSDIEAGTVTVSVKCAGDLAGAQVEAEIYFDGQKVAGGPVNSWTRGETFRIKEPRLWDIGQPNLYELRLTLAANGQKDEVKGYFGMREIGFHKDEKGVQRIYLNGRKIFMQGTLDQGWWPDGLLTPPCDAAMQYDIDALKKHGFNFMRKHIKIEPRRYYYLCDKAGFPIWQDMVSGMSRSEEVYHYYRAELADMLKTLDNFPCIVAWIAYNEAWGQPCKEKTNCTIAWIKDTDRTRLCNGVSGWVDHGMGDTKDYHQYPSPLPVERESDRLTVVGEFGGLGYFVEGHLWDPNKKWGYRSDSELEASYARYGEIMDNLARCANEAFAASVYTQTTDVETEANGLLTYDRKVFKYDPERFAAMHRKVERVALSTKPVKQECFAPSARDTKTVWRYTTEKPAGEWTAPDFNDASWAKGEGGFGNKVITNDKGVVPGTSWETQDIWLRKTVELAKAPEGDVELEIFYDEDPEVYVNGVLVFKQGGYTGGYVHVTIPAETAGKAFRTGRNTLAVHCSNKLGGAMIDLGFYGKYILPED